MQPNSININTFKTLPCHGHHLPTEHPYYFSCDKYHSNKDYRRAPVQQLSPQEQIPVYSAIYINDSFSQDTCLNWIEYLYHPQIYKSMPCSDKGCSRKYCPYVHENEEPRHHSVRDKIDSHMNDFVGLSHVMSKIEDMKELKHYENLHKHAGDIEVERQKILKIKEKLDRQEKEENRKADSIKQHLHQLTSASQQQSQSHPQHFAEFIYGYKISVIEDRHHEFKMFKNKDFRHIAALILEYICAFLNSEGGTMYLGINDESIVYGLEVPQKWIDQLLLKIDNDGKVHMTPPLIPQKYQIRVIPVKNRKKLWLNVIEVKVFPPHTKQKVLNLYLREGYIRMNASNHRLSASDIMEYMRLNNTQKLEDTLKSSEEQLDSMNELELREIQSTLNKLNQKVEAKLKRKERRDSTDSKKTQ